VEAIMADFQDTIALPETRTALERLIEAAIARLDDLDGDPDLEPPLGAPSPKKTPCVEVGRWMAEQAARAGEDYVGELHRVPMLSQAHWAEGNTVDEAEEVSEDEGADDEREPDEEDCDLDSEDMGPASWWGTPHFRRQMSGFDQKAEQQRQECTTKAVQDAVDKLRGIQTRAGRKPVERLPMIGGAIAR
jgi:hypothetical protein